MNPPGSRTKTFSRIGSVARRLERLSRKQLVWVRFPAEPPLDMRSSSKSGRSSSISEMWVQILSDRSKFRALVSQSGRGTPLRTARVWVRVPPRAPLPEILGLHAGLAEWFQATVFQTVHGGSIPSIRTNGSRWLESQWRATRSGRAGGLSNRRKAGSSPAHVSSVEMAEDSGDRLQPGLRG